MIQVTDAEQLIAQHVPDWGIEQLPIEKCYGRVLAEDVLADRDYPPYHRVTMDGYAFFSEDLCPSYSIQTTQFAGEAPKTLQNGKVIEVMTGASLPTHADCVVQYEKCQKEYSARSGINVRSEVERRPFLNVHQKGSDAKRGDALLKSGTQMNSQHIAVAASVGKERLSVKSRPKVLLISTGNELVKDTPPNDFQIRPSNTTSLFSMLETIGVPCEKIHLPDNPPQISEALSQRIDAFDLYLFSGGVSMGKADFIPSVLAGLGVEKVFHRVAQKPGKPLWFGNKQGKLFFGLPGNPVSTSVCFVRYVLPLITRHKGVLLPLGQDLERKKDLTLFVPVVKAFKDGFPRLHQVSTNGSGDFISTARADGIVELGMQKSLYKQGEHVYFYAF